MKTFVIAEAGSTWRIGAKQKLHLAYAKKCIRVAKAAGADCVKFQWCSQPGLMAERRHMKNVGAYSLLAWPAEWLPSLAAECEEAGIEFLCTVFIPADVPCIAPFVRRFKIASLEAMDLELFEACERHQKPIILSTGALDHATLCDLDSQVGSNAYGVKLLQCTAAYPCPLNHLNLAMLKPGKFRMVHGLSDHSGDVMTGALAVACGAEIIEVHFRLDETRADNPDYVHSHPPAGLKQYIANIRKAELMLGDGMKKIEACEVDMVKHRVTA